MAPLLRWARRSPGAVLGALVLLFWCAAAATVPWWGLPDPTIRVGPRFAPPGGAFPLGTDALGRDVLARTLHGARLSLPLAVAVVGLAALIGALLGAIAGFLGGLVDMALSRLADVALAFPPVLLALAIAATLGPGLLNAGLAMLAVWWPIYLRLMRAQVRSVARMDHVDAAVASGSTRAAILRRHIVPLCWTPLLVALPLDLGQVILLGAGLSFVGLGAPPPAPEWGLMVAEGATSLHRWWVVAAPGAAVLSVVLACSAIGDSLQRSDRGGAG
jgi:peptide/nickel transport system permease protein